MYDPFILDRIHFDQEQRERRVAVSRKHRRTSRSDSTNCHGAPVRRISIVSAIPWQLPW